MRKCNAGWTLLVQTSVILQGIVGTCALLNQHKMDNQAITLTYKWTAKEGKLDELKAIYKTVGEEMKANEPDVPKMNCYYADEENAIFISEVFNDANALGFHLSGTAAKHFPDLLEIAVPGPFIFLGNVPDQLKQAAYGMNMGAIFATHAYGFERSPAGV